MDCSPPGSSVRGDSLGKDPGVGCLSSRVLVVVPSNGGQTRKADLQLSHSHVTAIAQRRGAECLLQAGERGPHLCLCRQVLPLGSLPPKAGHG